MTNENKTQKKKAKNGLLRSIRRSGWKSRIVILIICAVVVVGVVLSLSIKNEEGRVSTITETSLKKILEIDELATVDYTYNAIISRYMEESAEVMYHVAYEGIVTAGIEFSEIGIVVDEKTKKVTITIPPVEILDVRVNMDTMDYIFVKDKYETETISQEAYKLCKSDLENRVKKEDLLTKTARENAVASIKALFKPWIETVDTSYQVEFA